MRGETGEEEGNHNRAKGTTETSPIDLDSDDDGLRAAERIQRAGESPAWAMALIAL